MTVVAEPLATVDAVDRGDEGHEGHATMQRLSNRWQLERDTELFNVEVGPSPVPVDGRLRVGFTVTGAEGCEATVVASPPRVAARQPVWRGAAPVLSPDPRVVTASKAIDAAEQTVVMNLLLNRPWHPATVTVELELACSGRRRAVVRGPRRELRDDRGRHPGARAVLGVFSVRRVPTRVDVHRASPTIDGRLVAREWPGEGTALVDSVDGEPVAVRASRVWFAWDDRALYVAGRFDDPDVWSEMSTHDEPLWKQEVFEVFVAGPKTPDGARSGPYVELQVSPAGIAFDASFDDQREGSPAWNGAWNRAASVHGTINDASDRDEGWSAELAIPWSELCAKTDLVCPARPGLTLRLNAFRFERVERKRAQASALSPTLATDFHAWDNAARLELVNPAVARETKDEHR